MSGSLVSITAWAASTIRIPSLAVTPYIQGDVLVEWDADGTVIVSPRHQNWVVKVNRQTDEVVWILGEDGDFSLVGGDSAWFYSQYCPELHADGRILIYDNGNERPGTLDYSRAVIYQLDETSMTAEQVWEYETDNYSEFLGGVRLLDNGTPWSAPAAHSGPAHLPRSSR